VPALDAGVVDAQVVDAPGVDASVVDAAPDVDAAPPGPAFTIPSTPPAPVKGKRTVLGFRERKAVGHGLTVGFAEQGHKHRADGGGAGGIFELTFMRGAKTETMRLTTEGALEAEIDALGVLIVVTEERAGFVITTVGKAPRPLDDEAAAEMVEKAAAGHGLPSGNSTSYGVDHGVLSFAATRDTTQLWRARVGLYTRRLWFLPPRQ
jgi:hypothetical protein